MNGTSEPFAIYRRPGRYIVKRFEGTGEGFWSLLGPEYTRETAQELADSLTQDLRERRPVRRSA